MNKKKTATITIMIVGLVAVMIGVASYAYWQLTKKQASPNDMVSACLNFEMVGTSDAITLPSAWPTSDAEGQKHAGYTFTVENKCEEAVNYTISLESLASTNTNYLNYDNIRLSLDGKDVLAYGDLTTIDNVVLAEDTETIRETKEITTATVEGKDTNTHNIKLWLADNAPIEEQNKSFRSRIRITGGQGIENNTPIVLATGDISKTEECSTNTDGSGENYGVTTCVPVTGNNVKYTLYDNNELVISGVGETKDWQTDYYDPESGPGLVQDLISDVIESNEFTKEEQNIFYTNEIIKIYLGYFFGLSVVDFTNLSEILVGQQMVLTSYSELGSLIGLSETDAATFTSLVTKLEELGVLGATKNLVIKDGVTSIGQQMFTYVAFNDINMADTITIINKDAFYTSGVLNLFKLSNNLTYIADFGFAYFKALNVDMVLPTSLVNVDQNSFASMSVNTLKLPNNGLDRFPSKLQHVEEIYIPENILRFNVISENPSEVTLYMYGPERTIYYCGSGIHDLTVYKEVVWNYAD